MIVFIDLDKLEKVSLFFFRNTASIIKKTTNSFSFCPFNQPVLVERLTCEDTIEERIAVLQSRKQLYFDFSLQEGQGALNFSGKITVADILGLFKLDKGGKRLNAKASAAEASANAGAGIRGGGLAGGSGRGGRGGFGGYRGFGGGSP